MHLRLVWRGGGGLVPLIIAWSLRYSRQSELGNKADRKYIIYM